MGGGAFISDTKYPRPSDRIMETITDKDIMGLLPELEKHMGIHYRSMPILDREDIITEVLAKVWRRKDSVKDKRALVSYVQSTTRTTVMDHVRARGRRIDPCQLDEWMTDSDNHTFAFVDTGFDDVETSCLIDDVKALTHTQFERDLIDLLMEGHCEGSAATVLERSIPGVSHEAMKSRVRSSMRRLRERL